MEEKNRLRTTSKTERISKEPVRLELSVKSLDGMAGNVGVGIAFTSIVKPRVGLELYRLLSLKGSTTSLIWGTLNAENIFLSSIRAFGRAHRS